MRQYLLTHCEMSNGNSLLATKSDNVMNEIILMENNVIGNDPVNVSNIMNEYYVNITRSIGKDDSISIDDQFEDIIQTHTRRSSVLHIKESIKCDKHFSFSHINVENVWKKTILLKPS